MLINVNATLLIFNIYITILISYSEEGKMVGGRVFCLFWGLGGCLEFFVLLVWGVFLEAAHLRKQTQNG